MNVPVSQNGFLTQHVAGRLRQRIVRTDSLPRKVLQLQSYFPQKRLRQKNAAANAEINSTIEAGSGTTVISK